MASQFFRALLSYTGVSLGHLKVGAVIMLRGKRESVSVWQKETNWKQFNKLKKSITTDICVIGAGIAGITTAYLLQKEGRSVAVVDAWGLAAGETGRTTAHLTAVLDDRFFHLNSLFGEDNTRLAAESHKSAINKIENIIRDENIECDFERLDGYLVAPYAEQRKDFDKEENATLKIFPDRERFDRVPIGGIDIGPALRFPQQATFHIGKYITGLAEAFERLGGQIYTGTHIHEVKGGEKAYAETDDGIRVNPSAIVVATNTPINDWVKMHTKQAAYRTYVIAYRIPKNTYPPFLLWDMEDPYHYVRILRDKDHDILIVGGEDHKTGQANDARMRYKRLNIWARCFFSTLGPIIYEWSGQIMEPVDGLAFIGHNPLDKDNVYIATGDSGNGMTHGTIAGILITDLIQGRENPWKDLYDPARKNLKSTPTYIKENANFVGCMVADWAGSGEVNSISGIPPGEGAVMRKGLSKVAVYKDENGSISECSAVCTHLGCVVQWNSEEKSWDCPCHGSRFDTDGKILNGPATRRLQEEFEPHETEIPAGDKSESLPRVSQFWD
jgi:glycine/D-amino acid oxidase-like deaminating enzyme/nitrite reductase/ring-hydroxylating ferredoxin subunit